MNSLIEKFESGSAMTIEQQEAFLAHQNLNTHKQMFGVGFVGMCQDLKAIRDKHYYKALGYEDFGAYTEAEHNIKQRQAYKYIQVLEQLGIELLHSSAKLGVTKLIELASLDNEDRTKLLEKHSIDELDEMTTAEVKRLTEENRKLYEQLSFFENEKSKVVEKVVEEEKPTISDEEREKIELEIAKKYKAEMDALKERNKQTLEDEKKKNADALKALTEEKSKLKGLEDKVKELEAREEESKAEIEKVKELEAKFKKAEEEKTAIEKKIKMSENPELTRCRFLFESWQKSSVDLVAQIKKLSEDEANRVRMAIAKAKENLGL